MNDTEQFLSLPDEEAFKLLEEMASTPGVAGERRMCALYENKEAREKWLRIIIEARDKAYLKRLDD